MSTETAENRQTPRSHLVLILLLVAVFALFFSYVAIMRHERLQSTGYDLGNYDQAIWNTAQGRLFEFSGWKGKDNWFAEPGSMLGLHVEPILFFIVPLYWLWENVRVLLILQSVIVSMGAVGIWLLARWKYGDAAGSSSRPVAWAALALAAAFLLNPAIQSLTVSDFHGVALVGGFLPFAIYFMLRRRYGMFALFALLIAMTKEDMPIFVALMGLYIFIFQGLRGTERIARRKAFLVGGGAFVLGMAWAALAFLVIIPHYNILASSPYTWRYQAILGDEGLTLATLPHVIFATLQALFNRQTLKYAVGLLLPTAFLALFDLPLLLIGSFSFVMNATSAFAIQQNLGGHYVAALVPLIIAAAVTGIAHFIRLFRGEDNRLAHWVPDRVKRMSVGRWHLILALLVLLFTLGAQRDYGFTPLTRGFKWPIMLDHYRLAQRFFDQIPPDASVSTSQSLEPHLTHRRQITILPFDRSGEYYLIDITRDWRNDDPNNHQWLLDNIVHAPGYGILDAADGFMLLQRGAPEQTIPDAFYDIFREAEATPQYPMQVDFGNAIRFLGFDNRRGTEMDLYFQALQPLSQDLFITLYLTDADYQLRGGIEKRQTALIWFPTSQWTPGEVVRIPFRHIPWDSKELGTFSVALGVLEGDDLWDAQLRLPPTLLSSDQNPRRIAEGTLWHLMQFRWEGDDVSPLPDPVLDAPPSSSTRTDVQFGDLATLEGYEVHTANPKPGDELSVDLYWRALEPTDINYTVFFQVVGPDGRIYAQQDNPPGKGTLRTNWWQSGMLIPDSYRVVIASDAPPGDYVIHIGFYNPDDGQRVNLKDFNGNSYYAIPFQMH
jgi:uncharacterized membrane protein